jgi:hypothetical protein
MSDTQRIALLEERIFNLEKQVEDANLRTASALGVLATLTLIGRGPALSDIQRQALNRMREEARLELSF